MGVLIDTSVFVTVERGGGELGSLIELVGDQEAAISVITASELLHGVHRADSAVRRSRRSAFVEAVFASVPVIPFDLPVAREHSRLWADLSRRGEGIGAHDLILAATALHHRSAIVTHNPRHFGRVEGLEVVALPAA